MSVLRCLAVDPGERVGWATGEIMLPPGAGEPRLRVANHGIAFLKDCALAVHKAVVLEDRIDVLIYETWRLRAAKAREFAGNDMQPSQFIGMVRLCAWLNPRVQLVSQGPSAKSSALKSTKSHRDGGDIQARLAKLPKSHDDAHDGDALLHLWTYFFDRHV